MALSADSLLVYTQKANLGARQVHNVRHPVGSPEHDMLSIEQDVWPHALRQSLNLNPILGVQSGHCCPSPHHTGTSAQPVCMRRALGPAMARLLLLLCQVAAHSQASPCQGAHPPFGCIPGHPQLMYLSCLAKEPSQLLLTKALGQSADEDLPGGQGRAFGGRQGVDTHTEHITIISTPQPPAGSSRWYKRRMPTSEP